MRMPGRSTAAEEGVASWIDPPDAGCCWCCCPERMMVVVAVVVAAAAAAAAAAAVGPAAVAGWMWDGCKSAEAGADVEVSIVLS